MYTDKDIDSAIDQGVLSEQDAAAFRAHVSQLRKTQTQDNEQFSLIGGFHDVFIAIACVLVLVSIGYLGVVLTGIVFPRAMVGLFIGGGLSTMLASWGLAEFFTRKRQKALPSIILVLGFVIGTIFSAGAIVELVNGDGGIEDFNGADFGFDGVVVIGVTVIALFAHWRRFKVPITVAALTFAIIGFFGILVGFAIRPIPLNIFLFLGGLATLAVALRWDISDLERQTRRSDVAFWLHLLAAPLLVHPIFVSLNVFEPDTSVISAAVIILAYGVMSVISLSLDRRALMVSGLGYALYAFYVILESIGFTGVSFSIAGLVIGSGLLLMSAFWEYCRRGLVRHYPVFLQKLLPK